MIPAAIQHQFEFWSHIGQVGGYFHQYEGFSSLSPKDTTWPSKIFSLKRHHIERLKGHIERYKLTKSVAVAEDEPIEALLKTEGFIPTSSVEAMTMKVQLKIAYTEYPEIEKVADEIEAKIFAKIASEAFGYNIYDSIISPIIQSEKVQFFLGKHKGNYVSCGIVFQDSNGDSGLHMIGALQEYRGLGLGRKMTEHLLSIALRNGSKNIHLVASKLGAPIYYKLGFRNHGYLKAYSI